MSASQAQPEAGGAGGNDIKDPPLPCSEIIYKAVHGEWLRREFPHWPESNVEVPEVIPYGTVYYTTKGLTIGDGATAHVEQLESGDIIKYPKSNPWWPAEEEARREDMRTELAIYKRLGPCPYVPRALRWNPRDCSITFRLLDNGDLGSYVHMSGDMIPLHIRHDWLLQAAAALRAVHAMGVIHCDFTPRNLLLNERLDLYLSDFAGSSLDGAPPTISAGPRYVPPTWDGRAPPKKSDDLFALGSVMYFILAGVEPHHRIADQDVQAVYRRGVYPSIDRVHCGSLIRGLWEGSITSADMVVKALLCLYPANVAGGRYVSGSLESALAPDRSMVNYRSG